MAFYGTKLDPRKFKKFIYIYIVISLKVQYFVTWRIKGLVSEGLSGGAEKALRK
jgi:hypothetical protein